MLTYSSFNTFEDVVKHYENTKPIREQGHGTSRNVRPIGDRARKWENIQKISRNCYAITVGYERGNDLFRYWGYNTTTIDANNNYVTTYNDHGAKLEDYAPIVWRKRKDGTVTVTINNMTGIGYSVSHYSMLERHLPNGMAFVHNGSGKQYISLVQNGRSTDKLYLAKNKTIPRAEWAKVKHDGNEKHHWHKWKRMFDDNSALTFIQRSIGVWEHDGISGRSLPTGPKVNKALKAKFKPAMDKLFEWGMAMTPLLPLEFEYNRLKTAEMHGYFCDREGLKNTWSPWKPEWAREILKDENHPYRLNFWIMFAASTNDGWYMNQTFAIKEVQNKEDLSKIRARYNSYINNNAGFIIKGE